MKVATMRGVQEEVVRQSLGDGWVAEYQMRAEDGNPTVIGVHVYAADFDDLPLRRRPLPSGGLGARVLRRLKPARAQRDMRQHLAERPRSTPRSQPNPLSDLLASHGYAEPLPPERSPSGRRRHQPGFYAVIAEAYVRALDTGSRKPVDAVARSLGYSTTRIRDLLVRARDLGLLTRTSRGRPGGTLTETGRRALADYKARGLSKPVHAQERPATADKTTIHADSQLPGAEPDRACHVGRDLDSAIDRELEIDGAQFRRLSGRFVAGERAARPGRAS